MTFSNASFIQLKSFALLEHVPTFHNESALMSELAVLHVQQTIESVAGVDGSAAHTSFQIVYLGGDATNPTAISRIKSFLASGAGVTAFTFRRSKFNKAFTPPWRNIHLGQTSDRNYLARLLPLLRGILTLCVHGKALRCADVIYARMIDSALLGIIAKWMTGAHATIVYEIEDVQAVFFKPGLAGEIFRWFERRVLRRAGLVVVMSPGFVRGYLEPVQAYRGPSFVLENKLILPQTSLPAAIAEESWKHKRTWTIGWFGTLRCPRSTEILAEIATRLGDQVEIYTRGYPTETGIESYLATVNAHPNWTYEGEYTIPDDLAAMYGRVHFSWCFDFLDPGGNSELLLACRMYQGGYYGAVPLVPEKTEMARFLEPRHIGHTFQEPYAENIARFLQDLNWDNYVAERARVTDLRDTVWSDRGDDVQRLFGAIRAVAGAPASRTSSASIRDA